MSISFTPTTPTDRIVRPKDVRALTGLSRTTIWRLETAQEFPQRLELSPGAVGYRLSEILNWMQSRKHVGGPQ